MTDNERKELIQKLDDVAKLGGRLYDIEEKLEQNPNITKDLLNNIKESVDIIRDCKELVKKLKDYLD